MEKQQKTGKRGMKLWHLAAGIVAGLLVFCLPLLFPQAIPNEGKLVLFLVGLAILAATVLIFVSQRGGVRCPNCGKRWYGNPVAIGARTHEGIFRCPHCGTMIDRK